MLDAQPLWETALQLGRHGFVARARWHLLKHAQSGNAIADPKFDYHTVAIRTQGELDVADPFPGEWRVCEVIKRPDNPFPERISVGRANNCDIVLRFPFVSKLHAHFLAGAGAGLRLSDHRSANGTTVAGRALVAGEAVDIHSGDWIGFGPLRVQLLDASDLYDALARAFST
jgi:hypothetical protein